MVELEGVAVVDEETQPLTELLAATGPSREELVVAAGPPLQEHRAELAERASAASR